MFKTRLLSGIVLVAAALGLIIAGGDVLLLTALLVSYVGMYELYRILGIGGELPGILGYVAATVYYAELRFQFLPDSMMLVLGFLILLMAVYVFTYPKYRTEQVLAAFFGVFYVAVMLSFVYQTRMLAAGALLGMDAKQGWKIFRRDRFNHASPNSAQTESVCAGLLGLRLAGDAWYHGVLHKKPYIGDALRDIEHRDIPRACRLLYGTAFFALAVCGGVKLLVLLAL